MTQDQMVKSLASVGAMFAESTAKCVLASDPEGSKPSYHILAEGRYRQEERERVYSVAQLQDWVRTQKAVRSAVSEDAAYDIQQVYEAR